MPVVKKTVAVHPVMDEAVRKLWAVLIQRGYDATYSTALNALVLGGWVAPSYMRKGGREWDRYFETFNSFLHDQDTLQEIDLEDILAKFGQVVEVRRRETKKIEVRTETKSFERT